MESDGPLAIPKCVVDISSSLLIDSVVVSLLTERELDGNVGNATIVLRAAQLDWR